MKRLALPALIAAGILSVSPVRANGQGVITTVAGTPFTFPTNVTVASNAPLGNVYGVAVDSQGNVYVADSGNNRVFLASTNGNISIVAGNGTRGLSGDGGPAVSASLAAPLGVAVDASGDVFIADSQNSRIRKVSASGIITTFAGLGSYGFLGDGGPATSAELAAPSGVAVDASGNLFIADTNNNRIRKVSASGVITTVAGNGTAGYSGDGGPGASASLNNPYGVAVDAFGNLFIGDYLNNRVRKV